MDAVQQSLTAEKDDLKLVKRNGRGEGRTESHKRYGRIDDGRQEGGEQQLTKKEKREE